MTEIRDEFWEVDDEGRELLEIKEMIRLGFLKEDYFNRDLSAIEPLRSELSTVNKEIYALEKRLTTISSAENYLSHLIAEQRKVRIERVKAERIARRERKAVEKAQRLEDRRKEFLATPYFLGLGVSNRLIFEGGNEEKLKTLGLPVFSNVLELASLMKVEPEDVSWLCYERGTKQDDHYSRFEIPKRTGGTRLISSPKPKMRQAQTWINQQILSHLSPSDASFAFRPKKSIVDNAKVHLGAEVIVKLDIRDFFPTITFIRVRGYFEMLGYNPGIATVLALLCTDAPRRRVTVYGKSHIVAVDERSLPQGACTSPALSNLIGSMFDARIQGWLKYKNAGWRYTRYADDLTFSTTDSNANVGELIAMITRICKEEGFEIKDSKTRIMRKPRRQVVTGILLESDVRLTKTTLRSIRAFLHQCDTQGFEKVTERIGKDAQSVAKGYVAYVDMVMPGYSQKWRTKYSWL
jgi:retron-type reverse transcriptase